VIASAVDALRAPRRDPADSFVLHASLELMARVGLLELVDPADRTPALARIAELEAEFVAAGDPVDEPAAVDHADVRSAAAALAHALDAGDLDAVDAHAVWLAQRVDADGWCRVAGPLVVDSVAAAGHVPIGLHLLRRLDDGWLHPGLLRGPLRELARHPDWRITWFRTQSDAARREHGAQLDAGEALGMVPMLGRPGSDFIRPLMRQIEHDDTCIDLLRRALPSRPDADGVLAVTRACSRAAAWSMIHDDHGQAPYGWSHALTMSQAVMSFAGSGVAAQDAMAVALTFAAGFRAAHGTVALGPLDDGGVEAALRGVVRPERWTVTDLAARASAHHDAHVVKHTLASIHAAADDPAWAPVHLAAAGTLLEVWGAA
jgi:hypothetical protein